MILTLSRVCILAALGLIISHVSAEEYQGGATIVPISDGLPASYFNLKTDAASIYLEKAILFKNNGWFTKDKEVAVTARMSINSRKRTGSSTTLTISRVYKFDISIYDDGRIEIPLKSLPLLDAFNLSGDDYLVTSVVMDLFLSKRKEKSDFTKTLETVIEVSKKIPIPVSPYAEYASVFGDTFSQVVDKAINEGADTVPFASFGLRFLQGDKAAAFTEKPGVHAIVIGSNSPEIGVIALQKLDGKSLSYNETEGLKYEGSRVRNNYIIVRVTASTDPWKSLASSKDVLESISAEGKVALKLSEMQGISSPNLDAIVKRQLKANSATEISFDSHQLESAVKELNAIRATKTLNY
ncbi:hypothetical protein [Pseudomonas kilonensis]|uniref:hypothetical protein n=1 Tax=Pseudomonas kilonensis TaxID=132476 RepID=UPI0020A170FC|nr:hypothetical protein [Pseudomonas kilonensis]MCP1457591.1 hypothetical protein [Pseudomonas kilonensis]